MGTYPRLRQKRLAGKLRQIRDSLELSQSEILKRLGVEELIDAYRISEFETGKREPPLRILLEYARVANVWADVLIDDELDLPERMPSPKKHEGVRRKKR
ncbi:MAG TPA: helix-turn-helix transcriptional regulator [Pyrinomonadaceae bacterium]|nr:helix-turn-helix transcriptional regulator [Pyrinomonadaceae bacterium]